MRTIDADAAVKNFCDICKLDPAKCGGKCWPVQFIEKQETVDALPVRRGHWIVQPMDDMPGMHHEKYTCSECAGSYIGQRKRNYCPDCGAKLR